MPPSGGFYWQCGIALAFGIAVLAVLAYVARR